MPNYDITCCSTADMPLDFFKRKNIPFACFHFRIDGTEYSDDLGQSISFEDFYARIAAGAVPSTSQVNPGELMAMFEPILKQGRDVLHISLSSGISGAFNSAGIARKMLLQRYPQRKILLVDSLGASSGYGMLVEAAWGRRLAGSTIEETHAWLETNKLYLHHWFFSTDLKHYKRGGRISATAMLFGSLLNICPLMNMNRKGQLVPRAKIRGKQQAVQAIVRMMELHARNGIEYAGKCFISHSACLEEARAVATLVDDRFHKLDGKVLINSVGTVIGSHTGPGTMALFFWGDERET